MAPQATEKGPQPKVVSSLLFPNTRTMSQSTRIGFFIFDGSEELDWAGPWEVLSAWADNWPEDCAETLTIGRTKTPVTCAKGLRVIPDAGWDDAGRIDLLIYPGGRGVRAQLEDETVLAWVRALSRQGAILASVCTGAWIFAKAGLLDNSPATTHWIGLDILSNLGSNIDVRPEARFIDNGSVLTAAGVSAGIDLALHLVKRLQSAERAREVRRYIQYDPAPPI